MRDLVHRLSILQSIVSTAVTNGNTTTNGNGVDSFGYEGVMANMRLSARTDGTYTPKLQGSADNSTFYDMDAAAYDGGVAPGAANAVGNTSFGLAQKLSAAAVAASVDPNTLRYFRVCVTQATGTTGATFQADVILGFPHHSGSAV